RRGGALLTFADLKVGDRVHVKARQDGTHVIASEVRLQSPGDDDEDDDDDDNGSVEIEGPITALDATARTVTVGGKVVEIPATVIIRQGKRTLMFADLAVGDEVEIDARQDGTRLIATAVKVEDDDDVDDDEDEDDEDDDEEEEEEEEVKAPPPKRPATSKSKPVRAKAAPVAQKKAQGSVYRKPAPAPRAPAVPRKPARHFVPHVGLGLLVVAGSVWVDVAYRPVACLGIAIIIWAYLQIGSANEIIPGQR
ncbi:MAG TPA: DUF5666 domain-containing protein, partial [Polyangiaceae bacterium]|nr:DUF5666 domain-containing protein [Polyangiaceae bacterium]